MTSVWRATACIEHHTRVMFPRGRRFSYSLACSFSTTIKSEKRAGCSQLFLVLVNYLSFPPPPLPFTPVTYSPTVVTYNIYYHKSHWSVRFPRLSLMIFLPFKTVKLIFCAFFSLTSTSPSTAQQSLHLAKFFNCKVGYSSINHCLQNLKQCS